jgi:hypothetical protein
MKHANRPFVVALLLALILVCGVGISGTVKNKVNSMPDCAGQCKERYDTAMAQKCNKLSGPASEKCQSMAQKQYDSCLERCKGGNASSAERPSRR